MVLGALSVPDVPLCLGEFAVRLSHPPHFPFKALRGCLRENSLHRTGAMIHERVQAHVAGAEKTEPELGIGSPLELVRLEKLIDLRTAQSIPREQRGLPITHPPD